MMMGPCRTEHPPFYRKPPRSLLCGMSENSKTLLATNGRTNRSLCPIYLTAGYHTQAAECWHRHPYHGQRTLPRRGHRRDLHGGCRYLHCRQTPHRRANPHISGGKRAGRRSTRGGGRGWCRRWRWSRTRGFARGGRGGRGWWPTGVGRGQRWRFRSAVAFEVVQDLGLVAVLLRRTYLRLNFIWHPFISGIDSASIGEGRVRGRWAAQGSMALRIIPNCFKTLICCRSAPVVYPARGLIPTSRLCAYFSMRVPVAPL